MQCLCVLCVVYVGIALSSVAIDVSNICGAKAFKTASSDDAETFSSVDSLNFSKNAYDVFA